MSLVLLLLAVFVAHGTTSPLLHDVIGEGYDVLYGNPDERKDPGQRAQAIQLTYTSGKKTPDSRHGIPDVVTATDYPDSQCSYTGEVRIFFGDASYQEALSSSAMLSDASNWPGRFSLSTGWTAATNHSNFRSVTTSVLAQCPIYNVQLSTTGFKLTSAFQTAVQGLTSTKVAAFVKQFGTHYVKQVTFGSKTILEDTFAEWDYTRLENSVIVDYAAQQNFNASLLGIGSGSQAFETYVSSQQATRFGVPLPRGSSSSTWRSRSVYDPVPIKYHLSPITDLITPLYFPHTNPGTIAQKGNLVSAYLKGYCKATAGCSPPTQQVPPLNVTVITAIGKGVRYANAQCPKGMYISACGHQEPFKHGSFDEEKSIVPRSSTTCQCHDAFTDIECYALCFSRKIAGFQIVERAVSPKTRTPVTVKCPAGKVVLGCSAKYNFLAWEKPRYHPVSGGTGCYCEGPGITCYATCGYKSHLVDYEVQSVYGTHPKATCKQPGNVLLGCGYSAHTSHAEKWPAMHPTVDYQSCNCFNAYGAYCFAICGKVL